MNGNNLIGFLLVTGVAAMTRMARLGSAFPGLILLQTVGFQRHFRGGSRRAKGAFGCLAFLIANLASEALDLFLQPVYLDLLLQAAFAGRPVGTLSGKPFRDGSPPMNGSAGSGPVGLQLEKATPQSFGHWR